MDSKNILPISYFKSHANELLDQVQDSTEPLIITQNGYAKAVVQDIKAYEQTKNALALLQLVAMSEHDRKQGRVIDHDEVFKKLALRGKKSAH